MCDDVMSLLSYQIHVRLSLLSYQIHVRLLIALVISIAQPCLNRVQRVHRYLYIMSYTLESLHRLEKDIRGTFDSLTGAAKCKNITEVTKHVLMKGNNVSKDSLAGFVMEFIKIVNCSTDILKSASSNIDTLKSDQIVNQKLMLELKDEIIQKKDNHVQKVQEVVKTEVKSFSDIVKQNSPQIPGKTLQAAVKSAVDNDNRSRCVMVYGLREDPKTNLDTVVGGMLSEIAGAEKPFVRECYRLGTAKPGQHRPVRVCFSRSDSVSVVLSNAKNLKQSSQFNKTFLSPDRSPEERLIRRKLVESLKAKMEKEPEKYHFIRGGEICTTERKVTPQHSTEKKTIPQHSGFSIPQHSGFSIPQHSGFSIPQHSGFSTSSNRAAGLNKSFTQGPWIPGTLSISTPMKKR